MHIDEPTPALPSTHRRAWIDASNGVAGDMLLGALVDAGASLAEVQCAVDAVIPGTTELTAGSVHRAGMRATKVDVRTLVEDQPHRRWTEVRALIQAADVAAPVRERALAVFGRLAEAEGTAHGIDPEEVHFHEVGAWDSIADVVGVCAALHELGVTEVSGGPVAVGSGSVRTAHGQIPVPVPAVLELSAGWRVVAGGEGELATPTGMALVAALSSVCEDLPAMTVEAVGVGAGTRDVADRPNVVRVVIGAASPGRSAAGEPAAEADRTGAGDDPTEEAVLLETNVDDLDPRVWPGVLAALLEAGAADAWLVPVLMKKGRPAHVLSVLTAPTAVAALRDLVFALVPTFGIREQPVRRTVLARLWHTVNVDGRPVRTKVGHRGGVILSATPEFEDVAAVATDLGRPVRDVLDQARAAAATAGLVPGRETPAGL